VENDVAEAHGGVWLPWERPTRRMLSFWILKLHVLLERCHPQHLY